MTNLEPTNKKPDQFGQVRNADEDFASGKTPSAAEVSQNHARSDVDSGRKAQHHTLGNGRHQSSPGDHIHDGINGKKMGPMEMDPGTPGATRPALTCAAATPADIRTFLHNFFEFRDV